MSEHRKHLLSIADLGLDEIDEILRLTDSFVEVSERAIPKVPTLRGRTVVSLFFEESTRTRLSFETAAKRLSADTITFSSSGTSLSKGESLRDTALTIEAMGVEKFATAAKAAGIDGVIVVDYPPEECVDFSALMKKNDIDPIFLLAPTSTDKRIHEVARSGGGYLYYVSLRGVTGASNIDFSEISKKLPAIRAATRMPIGVGFGIRDPESARRVAASADAVVIGSRIIQEIEAGAAGEAVARVKAFLKPIREALDASFHR